jgi:RNA polymerase sigma factor (sigma-70 family)
MGSQIARSGERSSANAVRRWRDGDSGAADELAHSAMRLALRTAAALVESREEAADIAQEVAIDVLGSLDKLRDPEAFDAWVHRITVRRTLQRLRKRRRARAAETPLALLDDSDQPLAPEGLDRDTVLVARGALAELPPKQRLALALRYVHDLTDAEIAAALNCRTGTVHALLSRGRDALRQDKQLAELALTFKGG